MPAPMTTTSVSWLLSEVEGAVVVVDVVAEEALVTIVLRMLVLLVLTTLLVVAVRSTRLPPMHKPAAAADMAREGA